MWWTRELYLDLMCFGHAPRPMFVELFGPLIGLEDEWRAQGASEDEISLKAFDFDYMDLTDAGANCQILGGYAPRIIEETAEYIIESDALGRITKMIKGRATIGHCIQTPVSDWESWEAVKPFFTFNERRANMAQARAARAAQRRGTLVVSSIFGAFDLPRTLMGEELACIMCYEDPDLIKDMLSVARDTAIKTLERVTDVVQIDVLSSHEDMAGKSGPLWGPSQILEFSKPYYAPIWDLVSSRGTRLFSMDSDGDVTPIVPALLECGINCVYPNEPAAGMDIVALRRKYGKALSFKGGIDKFAVRSDKASVDRELEYKLAPALKCGTVFGLDHRIPDGTPLENYRYYVNRAREILNLPPVGNEPGWCRMAF